MEALEFMDFDMLDIINKGPIAIMHQSSYDGACDSKLKVKSVSRYHKDKKVVEALCKVKSCYWELTPFYVFHLVKNNSTT